jgi:PilZ domain
MSLRAQLEVEPRQGERRTKQRRRLRLEAEGSASTAETKVIVHDLSEDGLLVESPIPLSQGEILEVDIPGAGIVQAEVAWSSSGRFFGCRFKEPISTGAVSAALLRSPSQRLPSASFETVEKARIELEALSFAIKRMTRVVDKAIDQLTKKRD